MWGKATKWHRLLVLGLVLVVLVPVLAACDDDEEDVTVTVTETVTETYTGQPTSQTTTSATATHSEEGPVKIGVVSSWSGPAGIAGVVMITPVLDLIKDQVEEMGGILGGRSVEFVTHDDESSVAGAVAGIRKFASDDSISAVCYGGTSAAAIQASADASGKNQVPFFTIYTDYPEGTDLSYTTGVYSYKPSIFRKLMDLVYETEPDTIAIFGKDDYEAREVMPIYREEAESEGIKVVYDEMFVGGTADLSPYLTKIKYEDPDVLIAMPVLSDASVAMFKQIGDLGGWGDIQVFSPDSQALPAALKFPSGEGLTSWVSWIAGLEDPGAQEFEQAWVKKYGAPPSNEGIAYHYWAAWTAIKAIELADSADRRDIVEAAHSGALSWNTPAGPVTVGTDGLGYIDGYWVQIRDGEPVLLD